MSRIVFRDADKRRLLERIIHPDIQQAFTRQVSRITREAPDAIIVAEVPLLVEAKLQHLFDKIVLVYTSGQEQVRRLVARDGITPQEAAEMINAQLPIDEKRKFADYVVPNDADLEATRRNVRSLWNELTALHRRSGASGSPSPQKPR